MYLGGNRRLVALFGGPVFVWFVPSTMIFLAEAVYMVVGSSYLSARNSEILAHVNQKGARMSAF